MIIPPFYRPMSDLLFQAARRSPENIILLSLYTFISIFSSNSTAIPKKERRKKRAGVCACPEKIRVQRDDALLPIPDHPSALPVPL
jgi:hypothetical protein